jgi:DNA-binding FadR family transcriptional regulator
MKGATFETLKRLPAYRVVEEAVRQKILDGLLVPGDVLPGEHDLAEQLGVTRPTVREALRALESAGLVERGRRRRMVVSAPSPRVVRDAMRQAILLRGVTYRELWEVNLALEPAAAELAATAASPELLNAIAENLERTKRCLTDPSALAAADVEFHDLVTRASGNQALLLAREPLGELLFSAYGAVIRKIGPGRRLLEAHQRIYDALRARDGETARDWMAKHIRDFRRGCEVAGLDFEEPVTQLAQSRDE